jgi:hypothetical protein
MDNLTAIDKSLLQGQIVNVRELLNGLKGKVFEKSPLESPITVSTSNRGEFTEPLTIIYKCSNCDALHFKGGYFNETPYESGDVVYFDKSDQVGKYISRGELISMLEEDNIDLDCPIVISSSEDTGSFPMTMLFKCSERCDAVHILSYSKSDIIMN